jgi:hypothetical protein
MNPQAKKKGGFMENLKMSKKGKYPKMEMEHVAAMKKHGVPKKFIKQEQKEAMGMNMGGMAGYKKGGMAGCYAEGGAVKKPYVPSAGDRNEIAGGDQEMENRRLTGTAVEPAKTRRMAEYKRSLGLIPNADYRNEAKNTYHDAETGTPRKRVIKRNDKDLAAQSRMDELMGTPARQRGGGPGQRPSNYSTPVVGYARGGGIESKGKTKGRTC